MRFARTSIGWPLAAAMMAATLGGAPAPVLTQAGAQSASAAPVLQINTGRGRLITLARPMSDVFVASDAIADVQVRSPTQLYVFGKTAGETTISATSKSGGVIYSATVRVGNNLDSIQQMLTMAMPESRIVATPMNGLVLLTGVVASPADASEAERLVQAFVGDTTKVLSRLKTATPLQVNLQVKFAEVNRSFAKNIGSNLITRDTTGGFKFGLASGRAAGTITSANTSTFPLLDASSRYGLPAGTISLPFNPATGDFVIPNTGSAYNFTNLAGTARTALGLAGKLAGVDVLSAIDLGERIGQVTTLANPNLTALSGETGTFLAGGEIPIPISQGTLGGISVEFKQYGISISYTPTVLADGRISLRVRPEVSQLDYANAVTVGGTSIPGITTRRTETTVEVGSGQSFMIAGLLQNTHDNTFDKTPGLADVPVLGALFRSNAFQRNETELVIVITPYLVKPVDANSIVLPTDGYKAPTDIDRVLFGQLGGGKTGGDRPKPTMALPETAAAPAFGAVSPVAPAPKPEARREEKAPPPAKPKKGAPAAAPGFSF